MQPAQRFMRTAKIGGHAFLLDVKRGGGQRPLMPVVTMARPPPLDQRQRKRNNTSLARPTPVLPPMPVDPHTLTQAYEPFR